MKPVLFAPHSDDETLFAFYTVLHFNPRIVICYPSVRDYGDDRERLAETEAAMRIAGVEDVTFWGVRDDTELERAMRIYDEAFRPSMVFAPHAHASHINHVSVARAAMAVFLDRVVSYHTYDEHGKVRLGQRVVAAPEWTALKRQALACYRTQRTHPRAHVFYDEQRFELDEYVHSLPAAEETDPAGAAPAAVQPVKTRRGRSRR